MAIETSFTIKQVNVEQALKQAENKAKQTAQKIDGVLNQSAGKQIKNINKGVSALGNNLGGLGKIASTLTSKFAIVGAGIAFIIKGIKETWDDLMLSPQEYMTKQNFKIQQSRENTTESINRQNQDNGYFQRLQQLSNEENLSNAMKQEAIKLVQVLTKKYGDLGIQIDAVSGQIFNLDSAQSKMLKKQAQQLYKNLSLENTDISGLANAKMKASFARINENNFFTRSVYDLLQQQTGITRGSVKQGMNFINSKPLEQQIRILQGIREKATRETDIKDIQEIIELKKQQLKIEQKLKSLRDTGAIDEKTYMARLKESTTRNTVAKNRTIQRQQGSKQLAIGQSIIQMQQQADFAKLTKTSEQLVFLEKKLNQQKEKHKNLSSAVAEIESRKYDDDFQRSADKEYLERIEKRIAKLKQLQEQGVIIPPEQRELQRLEKQRLDLQTKIYPHDEERSEDLAAMAKLETQILENEKQQLKIKIEIEKLQEKSNRFYEERIQNYDDQLAVQKLLLQGKFEEAQKQKLINQLKRQGLKIDEQRVNKDEQKRKQLAQVTIQRQLNTDAKNLYDKYAPKTKEYRTQKRIQEIEESNKTRLTDQQKDTVKKIVGFEMQLEQLKSIKPSFNQIKTNQLTARGGFASGAVITDKDSVNRQIKTINEKQVSILKQIKDLISDGSKVP